MAGRERSEEGLREKLKEGKGVFLLFETTHLTMKAESLLKKKGIPNRLFPKPKKAISECGLVVKVLEADLASARELCKAGGLHIKEVIKVC